MSEESGWNTVSGAKEAKQQRAKANKAAALATAVPRIDPNDPSFDIAPREGFDWSARHAHDKVPNLSTLFNLNKAYLKGELEYSPSQQLILQSETSKLLAPLIRLNEYGMFTWSSQPPDDDVGMVHDYLGRFGRAGPTTGWYHVRQRPYVAFDVPQQRALTASPRVLRRFADKLLRHPDVYSTVGFPVGMKWHEFKKSPGSGYWDVEFRTETSLPGPEIPSTEWKFAATKEQLDSAPAITHLVHSDRSFLCDAWGAATTTKCTPIAVEVSARSWESTVDLIALVERLAVEAGITRVFAEDPDVEDDSWRRHWRTDLRRR